MAPSLRPLSSALAFPPCLRAGPQLSRVRITGVCIIRSPISGSMMKIGEAVRRFSGGRVLRELGGGKMRTLFPPRITIYHIGTVRFVYMALLKITSVFIAVFFFFIAIPSVLSSPESSESSSDYIILQLALCGITPLLLLTYLTTPIVAFIQMHLPPTARSSRTALTNFITHLPPTTRVTLTTLTPIGKPRMTTVEVRALRQAVPRRKMGLVDYVRTEADVEMDQKSRKWWNWRALSEFSISGGNGGVKEGWVWGELKARLERVAIREGKKI